jgi:hypothetical protein
VYVLVGRISHNEVLFGCLNKDREKGEAIGANGRNKLHTNIVRNHKKGIILET